MKRVIVTLIAALAVACESVDIHYVGDGGDAAATPDHASISDTGPVNVEEGDAVAAGGLCGCDFTQGQGCCVPSGGGTAFCTTNHDGCSQQGGIFVGCYAYDPSTDSACCWTGGASGGSQLAYASACASGPTSCVASSDCNGGTCKLAVCGGVTVGACDVEPTCP